MLRTYNPGYIGPKALLARLMSRQLGLPNCPDGKYSEVQAKGLYVATNKRSGEHVVLVATPYRANEGAGDVVPCD